MSTRRRKASSLASSPFLAPFTAPVTAALTAPLKAAMTVPGSAPFAKALKGSLKSPFRPPFTPALPTTALPDLLTQFAPWATAPRLDMAAYGQFLELQRKVWQMWIDSAQTIALRFMLAPPWMAASPWVRNEWIQMTAEKVAASQESMNLAVRAGFSPDSFSPRSLPRTAEGVLAPFTSRTRSNATRLGSRVLNGQALSAALEPVISKRAKSPRSTTAAATKAATPKVATTKRGRRHT